MYDYRRMTPDQREAIVAHRQARGFPLHKPPHLRLGEGWYFITAATLEHRTHFAAPLELTALERRLLEAFQAVKLPCAGWVVLPNHYHALVEAPELSIVGKALGPVHGRSSRYANQRDQTPGRRVWYKFTDRKVRSERHFWACLHYSLYNPVKHEYVEQMAEWPWSSYAELVARHGTEWVEDLAREYPLGDFGKGWDV
jgi:putative transposase